MSQQVRIRFYENSPESDYESYILSDCFELFESLKETLGVDNILSSPCTVNEDDWFEQIEEEIGEEVEDDDEYEEQIEKGLGKKGDFFLVSELLKSVNAYKEYFANHADRSFKLIQNRVTDGKALSADLENIEREFSRNPEGKARFVIG